MAIFLQDQHKILRFCKNRFVQGRAIFFVANNDASFPTLIISATYHSVSCGAFFCHNIHLLSNHTISQWQEYIQPFFEFFISDTFRRFSAWNILFHPCPKAFSGDHDSRSNSQFGKVFVAHQFITRRNGDSQQFCNCRDIQKNRQFACVFIIRIQHINILSSSRRYASSQKYSCGLTLRKNRCTSSTECITGYFCKTPATLPLYIPW